jgi:hypothetical protein
MRSFKKGVVNVKPTLEVHYFGAPSVKSFSQWNEYIILEHKSLNDILHMNNFCQINFNPFFGRFEDLCWRQSKRKMMAIFVELTKKDSISTVDVGHFGVCILELAIWEWQTIILFEVWWKINSHAYGMNFSRSYLKKWSVHQYRSQ